ncbi:guanylate-binding protein 5-like [Paramacrobiotus metropolitanus]|uniref:guanylate-binding protein 5-like n=1 Tax=Paramacrobiotus metropolitanus TaxID=2943436 RepID=UPI0024460DBF|nr:guanylate-binding protein 5-like [Paramacrobiotus metropolitanus]
MDQHVLIDKELEYDSLPCWCEHSKHKHTRQSVYQLAKIKENGSLKFINLDKFRKMLKSNEFVGQRKVAIISIVGTYRSGKSTLLNILSRYLACSSTTTRDWLYDDASVIPRYCRKRLFETSSAQFVCTKGMWITAHPYLMPNGLAVFLVDIQGLFDNHLNSSQTDSELFYASTLLSSTTNPPVPCTHRYQQ